MRPGAGTIRVELRVETLLGVMTAVCTRHANSLIRQRGAVLTARCHHGAGAAARKAGLRKRGIMDEGPQRHRVNPVVAVETDMPIAGLRTVDDAALGLPIREH